VQVPAWMSDRHWPWTWLGSLFSQCTLASASDLDLEGLSLDEGQRPTVPDEGPIVSLATMEKRERAKLDERAELNMETRQIQQILSIVEGLRQQPGALDEDHLASELHRIFHIFGASPPASAAAAYEGTPSLEDSEPHLKQQQVIKPYHHNGLLCTVIVRKVLSWTRRYLSSLAKQNALTGTFKADGPEGLVMALAVSLNREEQTELHGILRGLPTAALGDEVAQEETRVFINLKGDIREAQKLEESRVERRRQLVDVVVGVIVELIQTLGPTLSESKGKEKESNAQGSVARVAASLLMCVEEKDRMRLVMEQLLLLSEQWFSRDSQRRGERLKSLFPDSQYQEDPTEALVFIP